MISKILIANRGEIAVRIIRSAHEMGIQCVVVFSEADRQSLAVKMADQAILIGPPPPAESYLFYQNILSAALAAKVDAIHPGYGFFAENPSFAEACRALNLRFIGPSPNAMRQLGDKIVARRLMREAGVPVLPGSNTEEDHFDKLLNTADEIGYPVILKAAAGGGGRGMRIVNQRDELKKAYELVVNEAQKAFADGRIYLEKFIKDPKHIEVQILADKNGQVLHFFERDCSLQRRHQKLLEEAPANSIPQKIRERMLEASILAAKSTNYDSVGTVEFIYDMETESFYFIEMNTRIQVEHPVTEEITGIDLIKEQIKVAAGDPLTLKQEEIIIRGHAIECRINAEDPKLNFKPYPGQIKTYIVPGGMGIRIDSAAYSGYVIPPYYDSLIAKLIVHAPTRKEAMAKLKYALSEFEIAGIPTTIPFHQQVLKNKIFLSGKYTTGFVDEYF